MSKAEFDKQTFVGSLPPVLTLAADPPPLPCGAAFHRNALCLATRRPRGYTAPDTRIMLHDGLLVTLSGSPDKDGPGMTVDLSIIYRCGILDRGLGVAIELPAGGPFRTAAQTEPAGATA